MPSVLLISSTVMPDLSCEIRGTLVYGGATQKDLVVVQDWSERSAQTTAKRVSFNGVRKICFVFSIDYLIVELNGRFDLGIAMILIRCSFQFPGAQNYIRHLS